MPTRPTVTIFADASWCQRTKAAGWGAWIKADGRDAVQCGGAFRRKFPIAMHAELAALVTALSEAKRRSFVAPGATVMVQSDCTGALAALLTLPNVTDRPATDGLPVQPLREKYRKSVADFLTVAWALLQETGIVLVTRHVRGHQDGGGRQWVNRHCDQIARGAMRRRRAEMRDGQNRAV